MVVNCLGWIHLDYLGLAIIPETGSCSMAEKPFLLHLSQVPFKAVRPFGQDTEPFEDPLPAVVDVLSDGHVLARDTKITASRTETTDDK